MLGYRRSAVEDLIAEIADSFETVWRERHQLGDAVESLEAEIARLREREHALTQTLVAAEQAATHVREQAKREAEVILNEAHSEARSVTRDAQGERQRLQAEARRIEALLRAALGMIEESAPEGDTIGERPAGTESEPQQQQQPQLRKVSGGFDWVD